MTLTTNPPRTEQAGPQPRVSIVISVFNGADYIDQALKSAFDQTYDRCEIVVVDDASDDRTHELLIALRDDRLGMGDDRLRVYRNARRLGQAGNRNRALSLARGSFVKFLDHDDLLAPTCVEEMVELFQAHPQVGLVFCRRQILLPPAPSAADIAWLEEYGTLHLGYAPIGAVNHGPDMLAAWLRARSKQNWIGEPSAVMVRRAYLERVGGFGVHLRQLIDWELWARLMTRGDVGFVDRELCSYRHGQESESSRNLASNRNWLDLLWIYEAMASDAEFMDTHPELRGLLRAERRQAWRTVAKGARARDGKSVPVDVYRDYMTFRFLRALGRSPKLAGDIQPVPVSP